MSDSNVIRLVETAPGFPVDGEEALIQWCKDWLDAFGTANYEPLRSLVIVAETMDGNVCTVSQSLSVMDSARVIGLLTTAAHRKMDGRATTAEIEAER